MKLSEKAHAAQYFTDGFQLGLLEHVAESEKEREGPSGRSPHSRQRGIGASGWFFNLSQEGFSAPVSGGSGLSQCESEERTEASKTPGD